MPLVLLSKIATSLTAFTVTELSSVFVVTAQAFATIASNVLCGRWHPACSSLILIISGSFPTVRWRFQRIHNSITLLQRLHLCSRVIPCCRLQVQPSCGDSGRTVVDKDGDLPHRCMNLSKTWISWQQLIVDHVAQNIRTLSRTFRGSTSTKINLTRCMENASSHRKALSSSASASYTVVWLLYFLNGLVSIGAFAITPSVAFWIQKVADNIYVSIDVFQFFKFAAK